MTPKASESSVMTLCKGRRQCKVTDESIIESACSDGFRLFLCEETRVGSLMNPTLIELECSVTTLNKGRHSSLVIGGTEPILFKDFSDDSDVV